MHEREGFQTPHEEPFFFGFPSNPASPEKARLAVSSIPCIYIHTYIHTYTYLGPSGISKDVNHALGTDVVFSWIIAELDQVVARLSDLGGGGLFFVKKIKL